MSCESRVNDSLRNLLYEIEIRYWSIANQVIMRQGIFFKKWFDNGSLKKGGNIPSRERKVYDIGDRRQQRVYARFKEFCRYKIK